MSCCTAGKVPIRGPQSTPGRSGIAPQVGQALQRAFQRGLEIRAADIHDMQERKDGIYVQLTRRETDDRVNDLVRFDRIYCGLGMANDFKFTSILPAHFEPVVAGPREWLDAFRPFGPTGINYPGALPEADLGFLRQFERQLVDSGTIRPRVRPQLPSSPLA